MHTNGSQSCLIGSCGFCGDRECLDTFEFVNTLKRGLSDSTDKFVGVAENEIRRRSANAACKQASTSLFH